MKTRKIDVQYEVGDETFSAYQRKEIVEFNSEDQSAKVVGKWSDYTIAHEATDRFNTLAREREEILERHKKELRDFDSFQRREYDSILKRESYCKCENCTPKKD